MEKSIGTSVYPPRASEDFPLIAGLPPYVFAQVNEDKRRCIEAGMDVIDLGMGNPDLPTPPDIVHELLTQAVDGRHHRYSASRGIHGLREAIAAHYGSRYGVEIDPEREAVVTIGVKEGISHLMLAILGRGDTVLVPSPAYPIHTYSVVFAGGRVHPLSLRGLPDGRVDGETLVAEIENAVATVAPRPKALLLSFPNNPTTLVADAEFLARIVEVCRRERLLLVHDFAYADLGFDAEPPSLLAIPGAKEMSVEFFSMSKSYSMAGWRVGFCVGNPAMVEALTRVKSYLDYGIFQPIQIAAVQALRGDQSCVAEARDVYRRRRDALVDAMCTAGWGVAAPPATMFLWAPIPERFREMDSVAFSRLLLRETGVVVSPGVGFGEGGEGYVRFALIEGEERLREAGRRLAKVLA